MKFELNQDKVYLNLDNKTWTALTGYSNEDCCAVWEAYDNSNWCGFMDDSILCAGNMNVPIGVCNGDSGGPLTYFNGTHTGGFFLNF